MSLVSTLGKLAIGAIAAKGLGKMMSNGGGSSNPLGALMGGGGGQAGGLGALSGLLGGMGGQQSSGGGLGSILGALSGGGQQSGGLGGLLNQLGGGQQGGGLGGLLNQALAGQQIGEADVTSDQEAQAELMLRAMINACKADGQIDAEEQRKLTEHLGDVSAEEEQLVRQELTSPLDLQGLINRVPQGMEQQVYLMSLLAIDLDHQAEAQYLDQLARGMNISQQEVNAIHGQVGVPALYS